MTIKAIIGESEFAALDENIQGLYQQNGENKNYYLDLAQGEADKLAFGLQSERDKLTANNKALLDEKIKALEKLKEVEAAAQAAQDKKPVEGIDPEAHKSELARLKESLEGELVKERDAYTKLQHELAQTATQHEIDRLIIEYNLDPEDGPLILKNYIQGGVNDGKVEVGVFENGQPSLTAGSPTTPNQLLDGFLAAGKHKKLFLANNGGGTNATNNNRAGQGGAKTMKRSDFDKFATENPKGAAAFMAEGGKLV